MKKNMFLTSTGAQGLCIDCGTYNVELFKSKDYSSIIRFINKNTGNSIFTNSMFNIDWDEENDGGKLEIKFKDRWGSEMIFIHYAPSDLKGMFDFIVKGYSLFDGEF